MSKEELIHHLQRWYLELLGLEEGGAFALAIRMEIEHLYSMLARDELPTIHLPYQLGIFLRNVTILEREFRKKLPEILEKDRQDLQAFVASNPNLVGANR